MRAQSLLRGGWLNGPTRWWAGVLVAVIGAGTGHAQSPAGTLGGIRAHVDLPARQVQTGQPVWAIFLLENVTDNPITVTVPDAEPQLPSPAMGLPLAHVFSGRDATGVTITGENGQTWARPIRYRWQAAAPAVTVAPRSSIGLRLDLAEYFPVLRGTGKYRLTWQPYQQALTTESLVIEIAPHKQVELVTDCGRMTVRFFYDEAPAHVRNFLDLAGRGFYENLSFHRLEPGYFLLGGCPRGDGTGIRPDGKRVAAEINAHPHQKGTLSMALLDDDPDSGSCQFFICYTRQKDWDGRYTVFGELVGEESFATLDTLMATPVDESGRPQRPLYIRAVRISNVPTEPPAPPR
ncbi:MAG TPA: peptidylprolyl isomerase [Phycisphaerae bacterium]|nr:peptidylprolyl isomerase [Phycisphaerae bacterium]HNU45212.1 peptidylprolyl isomerase [Phycisphaerae bacterium]